MKDDYAIVKRLKSGEVLPVGSVPADLIRTADGEIHVSTVNGPQELVHAANINTVLQAAGGAQFDDWPANTAVMLHQVVAAPLTIGTVKTGDLLRSNSARTTGATFNATELAFWTEVSSDPVQSVAGKSGVVVLAKADVGLANVDNTSDAAKPVSTAQQTALNAKQATLVSGNSLKTLNGESVLGSGDIAITPTTVSSSVPTHDLDLVDDNYVGRALHLRPDGMVATANLALWSDSSGNGRDLAQATAGAQPDVIESSLNGLPVIRFDGTDDVMARATFDLSTSYSQFAVFRTGATNTGLISSEQYLGGTNNIRYVLGGDPSDGKLMGGVYSGTWNTAKDPVVLALSTVYLASFVRVSGGNQTLYKNGTQVAQTASGTNPTHDAARQLYIGKRWDAASPQFLNGDIAEIVMFPTALDVTERQKVEGYLAHKYGLLASLDAGHPYKVTAPQAGSLQVFADNASAITGGLTVGQVYMTSTGQLMVRY